MPFLAALSQNPNLFTPFPTNPPRIPNNNSQKPPPPPIPIPKYPPKKIPKNPQNPTPPRNPALKSFHHRSKYYKPISPDSGVVKTDGSDRSIILGESGLSYLLPGAPFEFQFSYSETPKAKPLAIREPPFLPFGPPTMPRPWTGKAPLKKSKKKKVPLFNSFDPPPPETEGVKRMETQRLLVLGRYPKEQKTREEILGNPLTRAEVRRLVQPYLSRNRQVNLAKNGIYISLVKDVRNAFEGSPLVKIDCQGMHASDYKKIGAKLKELVPCVLLSFDQEQILMWRGNDWKSMYQKPPPRVSDIHPSDGNISSSLVASDCGDSNASDTDNALSSSSSSRPRRVGLGQLGDASVRSTAKTEISSPRMMSLWKQAIESSKALLLDEIDLGPDALLEKVEEFEGTSQATEHSYRALILPSGNDLNISKTNHRGDGSEAATDDIGDEDDNDNDIFVSDSFEGDESSVPLGSLPVDLLAKRLISE
ncbi:CRS2-associated factor 2, chloroplastic isoform X3 [Magnolia sinica]|uniref:CRS2-associated factor 2, chloroplastic isoform X3 n=1 Tax=Magnolia sinica TaxID=86752 RepID=UPI0026593049|nr:CRS2-associated factor 2, chloroplastic isoform X3 [Magnolia sinica]